MTHDKWDSGGGDHKEGRAWVSESPRHLTFWPAAQCCQIVPKPRDPDLCGIADVSVLAANSEQF